MQEEGFIAKLLYPEGAKDVKLGQVVAIVVESKDDIAKFKDFSNAAPAPAAAPAAPKKEAAAPAQAAAPSSPAQAAPQKAQDSGRVFISPLAKKLADEAGVDVSSVQGSGPNARIIKSDVEAAIEAAKSAPKKSSAP